MRRWLRMLTAVLGAGICCFTLVLTAILIAMVVPENAAQSDCIIVPGCKVTNETPSLALQSRLDCALRLYRTGYAKVIIVSGGLGETGSVSEAQAMRMYLMTNGVPDNAIVLDENSYSTFQNMKNCKALMNERGLSSAIVATSDFHAARAVAIAKSAGIENVTCGKARFCWYAKWLYVVREVPAWGKYILNAAGIVQW